VQDQWAVLAIVRLGLALVVLAEHVEKVCDSGYLSLVSGISAVMAFLVISGYSMRASLERGGTDRAFYRRRAWRILPIYYVSLALSAAAYALFHQHATDGFPGVGESSALGWISQLTMTQGLLTPAVGAAAVTWTLSVECWLYALAPYLRRRETETVVVLLVASLWMYTQEDYWPILVHGLAFAALAWAWLVGFLVEPLIRRREWATAAGVLLLLAAPRMRVIPGTDYLGGIVLSGTLLACVYGALPRFSERGRRAMLWAGDLSYPLYLLHWPVLVLIFDSIGKRSPWNQPPTYVAAAFAVSALALQAIDLPLRRRAGTKRVAPATASTTGTEEAVIPFSHDIDDRREPTPKDAP